MGKRKINKIKCPSYLNVKQSKPHLRLVFILSHSPSLTTRGADFEEKATSGPAHFAKAHWKLSSLPLETEGGLPATLLTAVSLLYISKLVHAPGRASWPLAPLGCDGFIPWDELWHDLEGPAGSVKGLVGHGRARARDPCVMWLKGRNQNQSLLSSPVCHISARCCHTGLPRTMP